VSAGCVYGWIVALVSPKQKQWLYLAMNELGQLEDQTASVSRAYALHCLGDVQLPGKAIQQVFRATDAILRAGRVAVTEGDMT
jgi:hypothetical protein